MDVINTKRMKSIKEKAEAYDEAKARMSKACNSNRCTIGFMNEIFPELKESEDERIRKAILELVRQSSEVLDKQNQDKMLAWLEKQSKSNLIEEIKRRKEILLHEKEKAVSFAEKLSLGGRIAILEELLVFADEKQVEQKSAWSEEDALRLEEVICMIEANGRWVRSDDAVKSVLDWLKSLQQRIGE